MIGTTTKRLTKGWTSSVAVVDTARNAPRMAKSP